MAEPDVTLTVGNLRYGGWKEARVSVGMERCVGDFELQVTDLWPGADYTRRIQPGDVCVLAVRGVPVITGYVDTLEMSIDAGQHEVRISGRDKAADLVDCSAVRSPGQWRRQHVTKIANDLAAPFNVPVKAAVSDGKPLESFALQDGETVFEAIERAAKLRGLMVVSDGVGGLELTRAGLLRCTDQLVLGGNVLSGSATLDMRDRYQTYTAKGQAAGSNTFNGPAAAHIKAQASDPGVLRYRPLLLTSDSPDAAGSLGDRVKWEASVRRARSNRVQLEVQGWTQADGTLWRHDRLVKVVAEPLRLDDDMLISGVTYTISDQGTRTQMELTLADAFTLEPIKPPKATGAKTTVPWDIAPGRR